MKEIKATPEVKAAILEWHRRKVELGTQEQLAYKFGISVAYVAHIIALAKERRYRGNSETA
ncbi:MAG TPA: hypothetical protein VNH83_17470 [Bryobacteraceae bacterium]|nr:hypothetical protein [Bryobacteraceae bacterium]